MVLLSRQDLSGWGKFMVGCSGRHEFAGLKRIAGALLLPLALLFSVAAVAQESGSGGISASGGLTSAIGQARGASAQPGRATMGSVPTPGGMGQQIDSSSAQPDAATAKQMLDAYRVKQQLGASEAQQKNDAEKTKDSNQDTKRSTDTEDRTLNEFQNFVAQSVGKILPMYGYNLFQGATSTFAPVDNIPVTPDYLIGPGDEIVIKGWGTIDIDFRAVVNRNGAIDLPKVGSVNVAGVRYQELQSYLKNAIGKVFRNFELNVTLGKLRSIQVFVVGQAKRPGVYTVSSLSTLVNTLFASGGPSSKGSMRHIQIKRNGKVVTELDLYDLLLKGDKTKDASLLPGDVIYIPPVGHLAAISGSVNNFAIYELKGEKTSLSDIIELAGGFTTTASGQKVKVERIEERKVRKVEEFQLDKFGLAHIVRDGDLVQVFSIDTRFDNVVTLRGNVAGPGRHPWKEGMRVKDLIPDMDSLIVPEYWQKQNQAPNVRIASEAGLRTEVKHGIAEINWDYAVIERLKKDELTTMLIPFNLGKAIAGNDPEQNLLLQPGDTVTVFSKDDIQVPTAKRSIYVRLEGEVNNAGVYKALPGETLRQLITRVGGLTPNAYLFGAEFNRESVREAQQRQLNEMVDKLEEAIQRNRVNKEQSALTKDEFDNTKVAVAQAGLVARLRKAQATGRIVLEIPQENAQMKDLPDLVLDDGDRFVVPAKPSMVSVFGMVYNPNSFIYRSGKGFADYLAQSGGLTRDADESKIYVLHADGSVVSTQNSSSVFSTNSGVAIMPGDAVIVPELLDKTSVTKELMAWSEIFYKFALGVAGIKVLRL